MTSPTLSTREIKLLQMLEQGSCSKEIARHFGTVPGSARRYLSKLYKKLNVKNQVAAVAWYMASKTNKTDEINQDSVPVISPLRVRFSEGRFGDIALQCGLLAALGAMSRYVGDAHPGCRALWECLLAGDFATAIAYYQSQQKTEVHNTDASLWAALLLLGGQLGEGKRLAAILNKSGSRDEAKIIAALNAKLDGKDHVAWFALPKLAHTAATHHPAKHLAMVILFHLYQKNNDPVHARATANLLFKEAYTVCEEGRMLECSLPLQSPIQSAQP